MERTNQESFCGIKPDYYFENGLRKVKPYYFEYQTYAKQRWIGKSIFDVFAKEFRDRPAQYYQQAIEKELITVNVKPCDLKRVICNNDLIGHRLHRHEPPVTADAIKILHEAEGMLVIDKPASIPVHPSGRYRFNTIVGILAQEKGYKHLSCINRLDRLTSGVCILATDTEAAERLHQQMENRLFQKEYVAKVVGEFPEKMECDEPLLIVEHKLGLVSVDREKGKPSKTFFERISTDGNTSLVRCKPVTGRTHQIRVHLQALGHPIVNDILYNNHLWPKDITLLASDQLKDIAKKLMAETIDQEAILDETDAAIEKSPLELVDSLCPECSIHRADPKPEQLCIYLHAIKYSTSNWSFSTEMPFWAAASWKA